MRFMVSLIFDEAQMDEVTPEQMEEIATEMNRYNDELRKAGVMLAGEGLGPSGMARTLRWGEAGKPVATDGPFAESKEQLGGFWILECAGPRRGGRVGRKGAHPERRARGEADRRVRRRGPRAPSAAGRLLGPLPKPARGRTSAR